MFFNSWTMAVTGKTMHWPLNVPSYVLLSVLSIIYHAAVRCEPLSHLKLQRWGEIKAVFFCYVCWLCLSQRPVGCVQKWMSCASSVNKQWDDTRGCLECKHLLLLLWLVVSVQWIASDHRSGQGASLSNVILHYTILQYDTGMFLKFIWLILFYVRLDNAIVVLEL